MNTITDVWFLDASRWLWDYFLLATVLLAVVLVLGKFLAQPARRMAVHWSTATGLVLLALLCAVPGWSVVNLLSAPSEPPPVFRDAPLDAPLYDDGRQLFQQSHFSDFGPTTAEQSPTIAATTKIVAVDYGILISCVFAAGSILFTLWLALGHWQMRRLRSQAKSAPLELAALLPRLTPAGQRTPTLGIVAKLPVAAAVGLRRPMVLLPQNFLELTDPEKLQSVLAHELAHIRHRDLWLLALLRGLLLVLWPHPLYWLWRRSVRLDQETLADAAAADVTSRTHYAEQLVAWARVATESRTPRLASSVGLWESPSQLKRRIAILLDEKLIVLRECSRGWRVGSALGMLLIAGGLSLITLQPAKPAIAKTETDKSFANTGFRPTAMKLASGATVELLAIGTHAQKTQEWWDADGRPCTEPYKVLPATNISPQPKGQIVFRVLGADEGANVRWNTLPASNSGEGSIVVDGKKDPPGYHVHAFEWPKKDKLLSFRVGVATSKWKTLVKGSSSAHVSLEKSIVLSRALSDSHGNAVLVASHNLGDVATRGIAIDKSGRQHASTPKSRVNLSAGVQNQSYWSFAGLRPEDVKTFGLQARDYEWVEFENLPAAPSLSK